MLTPEAGVDPTVTELRPSGAAPGEGLEAEVLFEEARRRQRRRRLRWTAALLVLVVALVARAVLADGGSSRPDRPASSAPAPDPAPVVAATAGTAWHEAGATLWRHGHGGNFAAFPRDSVTCAARGTRSSCYVVIQSNGIEPDGSRVDPNVALGLAALRASLFRSDDLGATWTTLELPADTWISSALVCSDADTCSVAAIVGAGTSPGSTGRTVLLRTRDGGRHWSVMPLPTDVGEVMQLACSGPQHCLVAAFAPRSPTTIAGAGPQFGFDRFFPTTLLTTDDAGSTWSTVALAMPADRYFSASALRCLSATSCTADGFEATITVAGDGYAPTDITRVGLFSGDGGRIWSTVSSAVMDTTSTSAACADNLVCLQITQDGRTVPPSSPSAASSPDGGRTWSPLASVGLRPGTVLGCSPPQRCISATADGIATTFDGGRTWLSGGDPVVTPGDFLAYAGGDAGSCLPNGVCLVLQDMYHRSSGPPSLPTDYVPDAVRVLSNALPPTAKGS